ncbi:MAG: hypothetical protein M1815_003052 [Lichina confinis]|nr:MAG: hypothetical protein M1815_003052 [Lichina confinis]
MSTNRPFFASFFAAFRAHSVIQQASSTTGSGSASAAAAVVHAATSASSSSRQTAIGPSSPRTISTKAAPSPGAASAAAQVAAGHLQSRTQQPSSGLSISPTSPGGHIGNKSTGQRRDSSSSSEGFRDALGTEKLYIGGRTPSGEERFYRLGMAKRHRSIDRLSLDRLSI